jgi:hypothetical protein
MSKMKDILEWTLKMCSRHASKLSVAYQIDKRGRKWWLELFHLGNQFQHFACTKLDASVAKKEAGCS